MVPIKEVGTSNSDRPKARIFISYARRDLEFADRVDKALKEDGFDTLIDRSDIYALEDWWKRIETLITQADTIVFILSPDAVSSDICQKEVNFAASLNKRLAPIVYRRVDDTIIPTELARLNFIFFDDPAQFDVSLDRLTEALETDIDWVRKHTEFGEQARRWMIAGRPGPRGILLRPPALDEAERWIASRPRGAPLPTETTQAFITASRQAHIRRRNIVSGGLATGLLVALMLAGLAFWQRNIALEQRKIAVKQTNVAEQRLDIAYRWDSAFRAERSHELQRQGDYAQSGLTALSGLPNSLVHPNRPIVNETVLALGEATLLDPSLGILHGHTGRVFSAKFSHDGKRVVTASEDGTARVWDAASGREVFSIRPNSGSTGSITKALFSYDDRWIAICGDDGLLQIVDAASGHVALRLTGNWPKLGETQVLSVAFSHNNRRIAAAYGDGMAAIWDATTGHQLVTLKGHSGSVTSIAFDPSDRRVVTGSDDATARIWDSVSGTGLLTIRGHRDWVDCVDFSPDGSLIATASEDGTAKIWNAVSGKLVLSFEDHTDKVFSISFSPDGRQLITASKDKTVKIWSAQSGELLQELRGHTGFVYDARFDSGGTQVVTASEDGAVRLWRTRNGVKSATKMEVGIRSIRLAQSDRVLVLEGDDGNLYSWDFVASRPVAVSSLRQVDKIEFVAPSADYELMLTIAEDKRTEIRRLSDGGLLKTINANDYPKSPFEQKSIVPTMSDFNAHKDVISLLGNSSAIGIWRYPSYEQATFISGHSGIVNSLKLNTQGTQFVTSSDDHTAKIWDAITGAEIRTLVGHSAEVRTAEFSQDGKRVLTTSSFDDTVRIWDSETGHEVAEIKGPFGNPFDFLAPELGTHLPTLSRITASQPEARISADGKRVLTNAPGFDARIWDADSGALLATLRGHSASILGMFFSPDGQFAVTTSQDGTARVWDSSTGLPTVILDSLSGWITGGVVMANSTDVVLYSNSSVIVDFDLSHVRPDILLDYARASSFLPGAGDDTNLANLEADGERHASSDGDAVIQCDNLAGNPLDTDNVQQKGHLVIPDVKDAIEVCRKALNEHPNYPRLQYELGRALHAKGDEAEALDLSSRACDGNYASACNNEGAIIQYSEKVHGTARRPVDYYQKAVSLGSFQAEYFLGLIYWDGADGTAVDTDKGIKLLTDAAQHGDPFANQKLGDIYSSRKMDTGNSALALFHLAIAAQVFEKLGMKDEAAVAIGLRGTLARHMNPALVAAVWREKVATWTPVPPRIK